MNPTNPINALTEGDAGDDPLALFARWYADARRAQIHLPEAVALGTASTTGQPSVRMVLLKGHDARGFVFFTHCESRKARELADNPLAALTFWWGALERQVRIEGRIGRTSDSEADAYFATRPVGSQCSAWASPQSQEIPNRATLAAAAQEVATRFAGREVPRPPFWGGYRLQPDMMEFWQGRPDRLHDRLRYTRGAGGAWVRVRLGP